MGHLDAIKERLVVTGQVRCLSGLRVGASKGSGLVGASDLPVLRDARMRPYIPGTSLKGVLRSAIEGLVRGAAPVDAPWDAGGTPPSLWSCDPLANSQEAQENTRDGDEACMSKRWTDVLREHNGVSESEDLPLDLVLAQSCSVCRLFGNPELGARALVSDLPVRTDEDDPARLVEVRDGVAIDRDMLTAAPGLKYDFEVVPAGTCFGLEIVVDNPDDVDLGLLAAGLDALGAGFARLGGFGSRGLGRVELLELRATRRTARQFLRGEPAAAVGWEALAAAGRAALDVLLTDAAPGQEASHA